MTLGQRMIANLMNHGMYAPDEIRAVMGIAKKQTVEGGGFPEELWDEDCSGTQIALDLMWDFVRSIARAWIAENNPTATYRQFFEERE